MVSSLEDVSMRRIWGRLEEEAGVIWLRWDEEDCGLPSRSRSRSRPDAAAAAAAAEEEKLLGSGEKLPGARCCERPDCIFVCLLLYLLRYPSEEVERQTTRSIKKTEPVFVGGLWWRKCSRNWHLILERNGVHQRWSLLHLGGRQPNTANYGEKRWEKLVTRREKNAAMAKSL